MSRSAAWRVAASAALLLGSALSPSAASAQTTFRSACDLVTPEQVSQIVGTKVTYLLDSSRAICSWVDADRFYPGGHQFYNGDSLDLWRDETTTDVTIAGRTALAVPKEDRAQVIVALDDGGTLKVSVDVRDTTVEDALARAKAVAEAIFAAGPVSAQPPTRAQVEPLQVPGSMCDLITSDEFNAIVGRAFSPPTASDGGCVIATPDLTDIVRLKLDGYRYETEVGTYASEELTVAQRPARWEPEYLELYVDAGDDRMLNVHFDSGGSETPDAMRDQAVAIAELVIPRMATGAAPLPEACGKLSLEEVTGISGVQVTQAGEIGPYCAYLAANGTDGVTVGMGPAADPATAWASMNQPAQPTPTDVAGHAAVSALGTATAGGPVGFLVVDLDGLPGGDGQVLLVATAGVPEGTDPIEVTKRIAELYISRL